MNEKDKPQTPPEGPDELKEPAMPTFYVNPGYSAPSLLSALIPNDASPSDKDAAFLGSVAVTSACLPNVYGYSDGKKVFPNLYLFVAAPAGSGKGRIAMCRKLAEPVQDSLRKEYEEEMQYYENHKSEGYVTRPKLKSLFIPADISSASFYTIFSENGGNGLIFETEADVLTSNFKSNGHWDTVLRKAFHHEPISEARNQVFVEVKDPRVGVVLTGTPRQVLKLTPYSESGLFSRFIYYVLSNNELSEWRDVYGETTCNEDTFHKVGKSIEVIYLTLSNRQNPLIIEFSETQRTMINTFFREAQADYYAEYGGSILGTVRRMNTIVFKVCQVLSVLRAYDSKNLGAQKLVCDDQDVDFVLNMANVLLQHAASVFQTMKRDTLNFNPVDSPIGKSQSLYDALPDSFTKKEALDIASALQIATSTVELYLKNWVNEGKISRVGRGEYEKSKQINRVDE